MKKEHDPKVVAKRLKDLRKQQGLTQKNLAEKAFVSVESIKQYETERYLPGIYNSTAIAEALNADVEYILGESDYINLFDMIDKTHSIEFRNTKSILYFYRYCEHVGCDLEKLISKREPTAAEIQEYNNLPPSERNSSIFADFSLQNELLNDSTDFIKRKYNELLQRK